MKDYTLTVRPFVPGVVESVILLSSEMSLDELAQDLFSRINDDRNVRIVRGSHQVIIPHHVLKNSITVIEEGSFHDNRGI